MILKWLWNGSETNYESKKTRPKCGSKNLTERWASGGGRKLEQYCRGENDTYCNDDCGWVSEPYTPPKRSIPNTLNLTINNFCGWYYIVYDKYGHVAISSATYEIKKDALEKMKESITPKKGYNDPAAPYTTVLFNVPYHVSIKGQKFKLKNGKMVKK